VKLDIISNVMLLNEERLEKIYPVLGEFRAFYTIMKRNLRELSGVLELAADLEMDHLEFGYMLAHNREMLAELPIYHHQEVNRTLDDLRSRAAELAIKARIPPPLVTDGEPIDDTRPIPRSEKPACRFLWQDLYVDSLGQVMACCIANGPVLGDTNTESIREIWRGGKSQRDTQDLPTFGRPGRAQILLFLWTPASQHGGT